MDRYNAFAERIATAIDEHIHETLVALSHPELSTEHSLTKLQSTIRNVLAEMDHATSGEHRLAIVKTKCLEEFSRVGSK